MTEQEAKDIMRAHGWSLLKRKRWRREYIYAARKEHGSRIEKYICPFAELANMTPSELIHILTT